MKSANEKKKKKKTLSQLLTGEGVEELFRGNAEAGVLERGRGNRRHPVDTLGNALDALGTVVHGVGGGHVGQESLRRADVGRRLVSPDGKGGERAGRSTRKKR